MNCSCCDKGCNGSINTYSPYTLPTIDFIGGSSQDLRFHVYWHSCGNPFDLENCTADFSVVSFVNKTGAPIITKAMTVEKIGVDVDGETIYNRLVVSLIPKETVNLSGKYIYQISIKKKDGKAEIPKQGIFYISNNINKAFIA